ncbi:MAG: N-6 DNA methylase [Planctomycetaceae bacterium]|nr:N-6 DNA methylase [Planctomycetaceae bacterium]
MLKLYDCFRKSGLCERWAEIYLVRILFCFFADVTDVFESNLFVNYILQNIDDGKNLAKILKAIFETINKSDSQRLSSIDNRQLNKFPFIKDDLFNERFNVTKFHPDSRAILIECCRIDWSQVSPEIFGEIFQNVTNNIKRRESGVHYTSDENILKLIKPLFLDDLYNEFYRYKKSKSVNRVKLLNEFHDKLSQLKFLDPSCGCGNFLVIAYRELRILETKILREIFDGGKRLNLAKYVKVNTNQFYGIEAAEFPSKIAKIAMRTMDNRMNKLTSEEFNQHFSRAFSDDSIPIYCANALEIDWGIIVTKNELNYIFGNPPFVGARIMNKRQKNELLREFYKIKKCRELDYVTAWFKKSAVFIQGTNIEVAFVSTNSICQGEQASILWKELIEKDGVKINFAHQTFKWNKETKDQNNNAAVHCVIVGFSLIERKTKRLFSYENVCGVANEMRVKHINAYLAAAENVFIESRSIPICDIPRINFGNQPIDGGYLTLTAEERETAIKNEPAVEKFIKRYVGSYEFINNIPRYCLWLADANADELQKIRFITKRLELVKIFRANSSRPETRELSKTPERFAFISHNGNDYIIIPGVSSERREYLPIGFMSGNVVASNACFVTFDSNFYHFAILNSRMHNAWMRYVCGRLEMRYRYSASIVYNNFPFPDKPSGSLLRQVENAAKNILDTRSKFANKTLAELYNPFTTPPELNKAHRELDEIVDQIYNQTFKDDPSRIAFLFERYKELTLQIRN